MSDNNTPGDLLVALQRMQFARAAKLDRQQLLVQAFALVLALLAFWLPPELAAYLISPVSLLLALIAFWMIVRSRDLRGLAEKARRVTVLVDGLGFRLSSSELRRFAALSEIEPGQLERWRARDYFATEEAAGLKRAFAMAEESCFWSHHLYLASAAATQWLLIADGVVMLACFLLALSPAFPHGSNSVSIFSTLASSLVVLEVLSRHLHYRKAAHETSEILVRLDHLRKAGGSQEDLIAALMDYNSLVETSPMMVWRAYERNADRLNNLWKEQYG